ncbi:MAG: NUDIX domain-containing protein [Promethearchaeota archaeon]
MLHVKFYKLNSIENEKLEFVVIDSQYKDGWLYAQHRDRDSWEIPGGHREKGELIEVAAKRELYEETGAKKFSLQPICEYSVTSGESTRYGKLFLADIEEMGSLPKMEIVKVQKFTQTPDLLTYPEIQPLLHKKVLSSIKHSNDSFLWHVCTKALVYYQNTQEPNREIQVLILNRIEDESDPFSGSIDLPGGELEHGETPEEGLYREILEEIGLKPRIIKLLNNWTLYPKDLHPILGLTYLSSVNSMDVKLSHEHRNYEWIRFKYWKDHKFPDWLQRDFSQLEAEFS